MAWAFDLFDALSCEGVTKLELLVVATVLAEVVAIFNSIYSYLRSAQKDKTLTVNLYN
jgi:hypothetical protein